jgi:molybdopterin-guanine dinucleotide biosynthesis protein A
MGPLGGLAAALHLARDEGYEAVLGCSVDCLDLPEDLPALLSPAPSCLAQQPVIGLWPTSCVEVLEAILTGDGSRSMRRFAEAAGARLVETEWTAGNINTPADLERYR